MSKEEEVKRLESKLFSVDSSLDKASVPNVNNLLSLEVLKRIYAGNPAAQNLISNFQQNNAEYLLRAIKAVSSNKQLSSKFGSSEGVQILAQKIKQLAMEEDFKKQLSDDIGGLITTVDTDDSIQSIFNKRFKEKRDNAIKNVVGDIKEQE